MPNNKFAGEQSTSSSISNLTAERAPGSDPSASDDDVSSIERFLEILRPDLQVGARDVDEPLRDYVERMLSALQDVRFELLTQLDELEQDLGEIIVYLDAQSAEAS